VFTEENLKQYSLLLFTSTNNNVFDTDEQRLAFRHFIEAGGGFVGIHSVVGTERNWDWFKMMIGGTFVWHPKFQPYQLQVIDQEHPSAAGLPAVWKKEDECYFVKEMYPGIKTILAHDISSLKEDDQEKIKLHAGAFSNLYPAAWYQKFDGGHIWITALGHDKKDYEDPTYVNHIFQGIKFIASQVKSKEYSKAYSQNRDDLVK
jgi:type 1 glutamine amidotransferase